MSIFDTIARTFKSNRTPTAAQIATLIGKADAEVAAAEAEVKAVAARTADAVLGGEAAIAEHRSVARQAAERLDYARQAREVLAGKLAAAEAQEAEAARRAAYDAAQATQKEAQAALMSRYDPAIEELRRLQKLVAQADQLAEAANADLPQGAERLLETEACRDVQAIPERIIAEELADEWFAAEGNSPVDPSKIARRQGREGVTYAPSSFGQRPIRCELRSVRKVTRQPWTPPSYASRIDDLELPSLMAAPAPAPKVITELVPLAEVVEAAE